MTSYPSQAVLKSKLREACSSEEMCESLSSKFANQPVSCNHRIAQMAAIKAAKETPGATEDDAASCAAVLTAFVDVNTCRK